MRPAGEFCWMDIKTPDLDATERELDSALGWECVVDPDDHRDPATVRKARFEGHWMAGLCSLRSGAYPPGTEPHVSYYVAVDDAARVHDAAVTAGGTSVAPPSPIAGLGVLATVVDPFGAAVSLWQPGTFAGWTHPVTPGTPRRLVHTSTTPTSAGRFYRDGLGLALSDAVFRTRTGEPPGWTALIQIADRPATTLAPVRLPSGHVFLFA
ncbi:hypothetical protein [Prauserella alba]|uniref:VOC domain-containing protein n=1 Tax=Prauserella alba TaxID=176898 RepID=A0ABN1V6U1_9PSEU|nr:hypothetical protein [Prauserella alba]MCP2181159.1 hypothetical protein [Prauserella alba]